MLSISIAKMPLVSNCVAFAKLIGNFTVLKYKNFKKSNDLSVFRHQTNNADAGDQLRQWVDANMEKVFDREQCIRLSRPTIG